MSVQVTANKNMFLLNTQKSHEQFLSILKFLLFVTLKHY